MKKNFLSFLIGSMLLAGMPLSISTFHELTTRDIVCTDSPVHFEINSYSQPELPDQSGTTRFVKNFTNDVRTNPRPFRLFFENSGPVSENFFRFVNQNGENANFSPQHSSLDIPLFIQFMTLII